MYVYIYIYTHVYVHTLETGDVDILAHDYCEARISQ